MPKKQKSALKKAKQIDKVKTLSYGLKPAPEIMKFGKLLGHGN